MVTPSEMNDAIQIATTLTAINGQAHIVVLDDGSFAPWAVRRQRPERMNLTRAVAMDIRRCEVLVRCQV
jgi:hypothetical protein